MNTRSPVLTGAWPENTATPKTRAVGITIINFNTAAQTLRCLQSLRDGDCAAAWVLVLDNASSDSDYARLLDGCQAMAGSELRLYRSPINLGFAEGSNFLAERLLEEPACRYIGLLNNDAVALPSFIRQLTDAFAAANADHHVGMAGGRMHQLHAPGSVDTLGITIYANLMPADRKTTEDPYLGPTGGCCIMDRAFVEDTISVSGYLFDSRFFCYCEDTDLVLRAVLRGYRPIFVNDVVALHEGQASSGGNYNDFIAYHGLRNALWMQWKLMPMVLRLRHSPSSLAAQMMTVVRYTLDGRLGVLLRVYKDAYARRAEFRQEGMRLSAYWKLNARALRRRFSSRFYRKGYIKLALAQLWNQIFQNLLYAIVRPGQRR